MYQPSLALEPQAATPPTVGADPGFDIGWRHAQCGVVPPADLLLGSTSVGQGWRAGRAVTGKAQGHGRAPAASMRRWLGLRVQAWREGVAFDSHALTPEALASLYPPRCPVLRRALGGPASSDTAPVVHRLNPQIGYAPGNLVVLAQLAARAASGCSVDQALHLARRAQTAAQAVEGLQQVQWQRLALLLSWTQPMPFSAATRLPLWLLPPPELQPVLAVQRLQWRVSQLFLRPGWGMRCRGLAAALPDANHRTEFHLFVSALGSRVLLTGTPLKADAIGVLATATLEDAWLHPLVQRRWAQLALALGEAGCDRWLQRLENHGTDEQAARTAAARPSFRDAAQLRPAHRAPLPASKRLRTARAAQSDLPLGLAPGASGTPGQTQATMLAHG